MHEKLQINERAESISPLKRNTQKKRVLKEIVSPAQSSPFVENELISEFQKDSLQEIVINLLNLRYLSNRNVSTNSF